MILLWILLVELENLYLEQMAWNGCKNFCIFETFLKKIYTVTFSCSSSTLKISDVYYSPLKTSKVHLISIVQWLICFYMFLHHGHHPPWLGISFERSLRGVLYTPLCLAGKQSTKVNRPLAYGLFLLSIQPWALMVGPLADSFKLSYITTHEPWW